MVYENSKIRYIMNLSSIEGTRRESRLYKGLEIRVVWGFLIGS